MSRPMTYAEALEAKKALGPEEAWSDVARRIVDIFYTLGYGDGESSAYADWQAALGEWCELPEEVDVLPLEVALYIARLQGRPLSQRVADVLKSEGEDT